MPLAYKNNSPKFLKELSNRYNYKGQLCIYFVFVHVNLLLLHVGHHVLFFCKDVIIVSFCFLNNIYVVIAKTSVPMIYSHTLMMKNSCSKASR